MAYTVWEGSWDVTVISLAPLGMISQQGNLAQQEHSQRDEGGGVRERQRDREIEGERRRVKGYLMGDWDGEAEGTSMAIWYPQSDSDF